MMSARSKMTARWEQCKNVATQKETDLDPPVAQIGGDLARSAILDPKPIRMSFTCSSPVNRSFRSGKERASIPVLIA